MRFVATLHGETGSEPSAVDVRDAGGELVATIGEKTVVLDVVRVASQWSVRVDGRVVDLTVRGEPAGLALTASGIRTTARIEAQRADRGDVVNDRKAAGRSVVRSPMPGRVLRVAVAAGESVTPGQPLVVIEAMKMENEVRAVATGVVAEVHVEAGATIDSGAPLVTVGNEPARLSDGVGAGSP